MAEADMWSASSADDAAASGAAGVCTALVRSWVISPIGTELPSPRHAATATRTTQGHARVSAKFRCKQAKSSG
jgi:hypothetical protein